MYEQGLNPSWISTTAQDFIYEAHRVWPGLVVWMEQAPAISSTVPDTGWSYDLSSELSEIRTGLLVMQPHTSPSTPGTKLAGWTRAQAALWSQVAAQGLSSESRQLTTPSWQQSRKQRGAAGRDRRGRGFRAAPTAGFTELEDSNWNKRPANGDHRANFPRPNEPGSVGARETRSACSDTKD